MIVPKYCDFRAFYDHDLAGAIPRVALRDLRHNNATLLLLAGAHPKVAQERLGHSTVSTTLAAIPNASHDITNRGAT